MRKIVLSFLIVLFAVNTFCCTTAIFSSKCTKSGKPILWKHRDSNSENNKVKQFYTSQYSFVGLINSQDKDGKEIWAGYNETGFAIMNSASYNLRKKGDTDVYDKEGVVMRLALEKCRTLTDFETLLDTLSKPSGIEANFGVADAYGGVAYYETSDLSYIKVDANDKEVAPEGYLIRTNYSFGGRDDSGYGFIRYKTARNIIENQLESSKVSPKFILSKLSKSVKNSLTLTDMYSLRAKEGENMFMDVTDCINRISSVSAVVINGVSSPENANQTSMWTLLGTPLLSLPVVSYLNKNIMLPPAITAEDTLNSPLCDMVLEVKDIVFPRKKGSVNYLNVSKVVNYEKTGYLQLIKPIENNLYYRAVKLEKELEVEYNANSIQYYYDKINNLIESKLQIIINKLNK